MSGEIDNKWINTFLYYQSSITTEDAKRVSIYLASLKSENERLKRDLGENPDGSRDFPLMLKRVQAKALMETNEELKAQLNKAEELIKYFWTEGSYGDGSDWMIDKCYDYFKSITKGTD